MQANAAIMLYVGDIHLSNCGKEPDGSTSGKGDIGVGKNVREAIIANGIQRCGSLSAQRCQSFRYGGIIGDRQRPYSIVTYSLQPGFEYSTRLG